MNAIKPPLPTEAEIKAELVRRSLGSPTMNWWVIVTRHMIFPVQTRMEAEEFNKSLLVIGSERKIYILKIDGSLIDNTLSFEAPKQNGFFDSLLDTLSKIF